MKSTFLKQFDVKLIKKTYFNFIKPTLFYFSGSHHHAEVESHNKKFDHVKYQRKLNQQQRIEENQKVNFVDDDVNEPTAIHAETNFRKDILNQVK